MNEKIKKSLDKILPSDEKRETILNNVMKPRKNKLVILTPIGLCLFVALLTLNNKEIPAPIPRVASAGIYYKGTCYEEVGIWNGNKENLIFIETTNEFIMGDKIYKYNDSIIFKNNESYIEYKLCGGKNE